MARDPLRYFRVEARDLVDKIGKALLDLEKGSAASDQVPLLLRLAHTLKGAARVVKQTAIADYAHSLEEALIPYRESGSVPANLVSSLLPIVDSMDALVAALAPASASTKNAAPSPVVRLEEPVVSTRLDAAEVDDLLNALGEVQSQMASLRQSLGSIERARNVLALLIGELARGHGRDGTRTGVAADDRARSMSQELGVLFGAMERKAVAATDQLDAELRQVHDMAEQLRLMRAGTLFMSLERTARDAAQTLNKEVTFEGRGADVRLDAQVLNAMQAALVQMVRNAVVHGIESPGERKALGKTPGGNVVVQVARRGPRVTFRCSDDGRGIDMEAVRQAASRKGWLSSESGEPSANDVLLLLKRGGITTSDSVTELSGRGIGLDVIREAAERLGGELSLRTEAARGTSLELTVPASMTAIDALLVEDAGIETAIPIEAIRRTMRVHPEAITRIPEGQSILYEGNAIPFVTLSAFHTGGSAPLARKARSVAIISGAGGTVALGVDRLAGRSSVVLRPLPRLAPASRIVAGTSLDANGNPRLVLDPDGIVAETLNLPRHEFEPVRQRKPILVIDDSLTTRMLEQSILESAGYNVDVAASAEEGIEKARGKRYALILVDVEMPGMDGFGFLKHANDDLHLRGIPVIMVTSRSEPEDKQRARDLGASGYVVKGEFDQVALLDRIKNLVRQ